MIHPTRITKQETTTSSDDDVDGINRLIRSENDIELNKTRSQRHSVWVKRLRLVLPVITLGFIAIVMSFSGHENKMTSVPREQILPNAVSRNELVNPKFQSEDNKNQPYTITADKAIQNTDEMDDILLEKPVADMSLSNKGWVAIKAQNGTYNQVNGSLNLDGQVEVRHDSGYELNSDKMMIDVKAKTIISPGAVTGHGPNADIKASGLEANDTTKTIIFTGPATLILRNNSLPPAPQ